MNRLSIQRWVVTGVAAVLMSGPAAQPGLAANREIDVRSTDRSPLGGRLTVTLEWRGKGPYNGRIFGHVHDTDQRDNHRVHGYALLDGEQRFLGEAGDSKRASQVNISFAKKHQVLVRVCLVGGNPSRDVYCSDWR